MSKPAFSTNEAIRFGWDVTKKNLGFFIVLLIIMIVLQGVFDPSQFKLRMDPAFESFGIRDLLSIIVSLIFGVTITKISLLLTDGKKVTKEEVVQSYRMIPNYIGGKILTFLIVAAGLLLFIIPGIIWFIRSQFTEYLIIDKGMRPVEAVKESFRMTKGSTLDLLGLWGMLMLISLLGVLALLIGLFVAIPTTWIATTYVYRKLAKTA